MFKNLVASLWGSSFGHVVARRHGSRAPGAAWAFTVAILLGGHAGAVIVERQQMRQVAPLITRETLVVFDMDNTLVQTTQSLGSDQWFRHVLKSYTDKGMPHEAALTKSLAYWKQVNEVSHVTAVESGTPGFIRRMQRAGVKVMVLTARAAGDAQLTARQLGEARLDFSASAPAGKTDVLIAPGLRYRDGVLFATGQDKGLSLIKFFRYFSLAPVKVVFVDDLLKNVQAVEAALAPRNLEVINVRYGALDEKVRSFDPEIALVEWGIFSKYHVLISDPQAARIIFRRRHGDAEAR